MISTLENAKQLARYIVLDLYETGIGTDEQKKEMFERADSKIADLILGHDKELEEEINKKYMEAIKEAIR